MNYFNSPLKSRLFFACLFLTATAAHSKTTIKFATLAPEGSMWMEQMKNFTREVSSKTGGEIEFKIYPGSIQGDEKDIVRKMRIGQIHCSGFTGVGIGEIAPEIRVLDTPFLFKNAGEIDYIYRKFASRFREIFRKNGYVLLGWAEVGIVNMFANRPVKKPGDLSKVKMWIWEGDPVAEATFRAMDANPISLSITDVMTSLETGMIDAVYASPLSAIALQWFVKMKYALSLPIANSSGAVLMTRKLFDKLDGEKQKILLEAGKKHFSNLTRLSRKDNLKAVETLKKHGVKYLEAGEEAKREFQRMGAEARRSLVGKIYSKEFLEEIEKALETLRKKRGKK